MKSFEGYKKRVMRFLHTPGERHVVAAASILGVSTLIWSLTTTRLQMGNADQLADSFLFSDKATFRQAQFPQAHTQLIKWPLFWLLARLHNAPAAYTTATIGLSLVTVGALAYLLHKLVHRPAVLGTLYLALACMLTLVPVQVTGEVGSPLNMAMVTGRNIEYVLYLVVLVLLLPAAQQPRRWYRLGAAAAMLSILFASDQLFLLCSVGSVLGFVAYAYGRRRPKLQSLALQWLIVTAISWAASGVILWAIGHATNIVGAPGDFAGFSLRFTSLGSAAGAATKAVLLNFGITAGAGRWAVVPALLSSLLLGLCLYAGYAVWHKALRRPPVQLDRTTLLSLLVSLSTITVCTVYVVANHQTSMDARYLTIASFAGFIILAAYVRTLRVSDCSMYWTGVVLGVGVVCGLLATVTHSNQVLATDPARIRTKQIAQLLDQHHTQILMGDFWQVLPIKEQTRQASQQILPLSGCLRPRQLLTSAAWRQDLYTHSFAYLLPLQSTGLSFGRCSLQTAIMLYGQPTTIVRVGGAQRSPKELLLFYNDGAARIRGNRPGVPTPVFGVPTEGTARPTGSTIVPLADPS